MGGRGERSGWSGIAGRFGLNRSWLESVFRTKEVFGNGLWIRQTRGWG